MSFSSSGRVHLPTNRPRRTLRTGYVKYTQIFNSMGMIEIGGAIVTFVLAIIAVAVAPHQVISPLMAIAGAGILLANGLLGIFSHAKSTFSWLAVSVVVAYVTVLLMIAGCAIVTSNSLTLATHPINTKTGVADGVIASYMIIAFMQVLMAVVSLIHAVYASSSILKKES